MVYYFEIFEGLFNNKVQYLIIGELGVNLYGVPRITQDIDLIISMDRDNVLRLVDTMKELGYQPRLPVDPVSLADPTEVKEWIESRNLIAFSFYHPESAYKVVDIVLTHPLDFGEAFKRRSVKSVHGVDFYLASIDDLIDCKKFSGRPQDLSDINLLEKAKSFLKEGK